MDKEFASKQSLEDVKKSIHDLSAEVKAGTGAMTETIEKMVNELVHKMPQFSGKSGLQYPVSTVGATPEIRRRAIVNQMPKELQIESDHLLILSKIMGCSPTETKSWHGFSGNLGDLKKALDSTTAGGVSEWVPTDLSANFFEFVRIDSVVAALFMTMPMPTSPFELPIGVGRISTFKHAEQTADTGQTLIPVGDVNSLSSKTTFTAQGHKSRVLFSKTIEEDSIVPLLPFVRAEMMKSMMEGREDAILNGDTAGTHQDSDVTSATDRRKLWLGLRAHALDQNFKTSLLTLNFSKLLDMRGNMGKYGASPRDLTYISGVVGMIKLLKLSEVVTVDKYGPQASILTGEVGKIGGIPFVLSGFQREDLNAVGVFETGKTRTALELVYRPGYAIGERRTLTVQLLTELYSDSDQDALITTERVDFQPIYPIAQNHTTELGIDL